MIQYISSQAKIGKHVKVWHFAVILDDVIIGDRVSIGTGAEIGRGTTIGSGSRISAHVFLPANSRIGKNVFIGPAVVCTDDKFPRAHNKNYCAQPPTIKDGASIGAGAIILPAVTIGTGAMVGAGSVVTKNVPDYSLVYGNPAKVIKKT